MTLKDLAVGTAVLISEDPKGCLVGLLILGAIIFFSVTYSAWNLLLLLPFGLLLKMSVH